MIDEKRLTQFERVLNRLYEATGLSTPAELQSVLGISRQAFYNAKRKEKVPNSWIESIKKQYGINPNWALDGEGAQDMDQFHRALSEKVYALRDITMMCINDVARYGLNSLEYKHANQLMSGVEKLRDRLDERAFKECPNLPKNDRLKIYYQGQDRKSEVTQDSAGKLCQPDITSTNDKATTVVELKQGPFTKAVASIEKALEGADQLAILNAVFAKLMPIRNEMAHATGASATEGFKEPSCHEESESHNIDNACGIDTDPPRT